MIEVAIPLVTMGDDELAAALRARGAPAWRARQIRDAVWQPWVRSFDDLHQLPRPLRNAISEEIDFLTARVTMETEADQGTTVKLLCALGDGQTIETVAMESPARGARKRRATVCVSSQVGCAVGCPFCATGRLGLLRSCSAAEIVDQVRLAGTALHDRGFGAVTHVVYMGMGEPLANLEATIASVEALLTAGISARRVTVSTSGVVPGIDRLAALGLPLTLAISLHAATDELRDRLVPLNRSHPIAALAEAAERYRQHTGRRVSLEWCLIGGVNDDIDQADRLRDLAESLDAHINVIPMNRIEGSAWGPPEPAVARRFLDRLRTVAMTVRDTRGADTDAACGQLRAGLEARRHQRADGSLTPPQRLRRR
jgi:23S rRNA (adenine2503-C2)-methyltransferase